MSNKADKFLQFVLEMAGHMSKSCEQDKKFDAVTFSTELPDGELFAIVCTNEAGHIWLCLYMRWRSLDAAEGLSLNDPSAQTIIY